MNKVPDQKLEMNSDQAWSNSVPVPLDPDVLTNPLPSPKRELVHILQLVQSIITPLTSPQQEGFWFDVAASGCYNKSRSWTAVIMLGRAPLLIMGHQVVTLSLNKNEARVIHDISPLIAPSAETLAIRGAKHLKILIESDNEGWNNSIPLTIPHPQSDYAVGFRREAFTR